MPDQRYALSLCRYHNSKQAWGPMSRVVQFSTAKQVDLYVQDLHRDQLILKWRRFVTMPEGSEGPQSTPSNVLEYQLKMQVCGPCTPSLAPSRTRQGGHAHLTCLGAPNGLGSFLEKHIFDPVLVAKHPIFVAFCDFGGAKMACNGLKSGSFHLFRHPQWV